MIKQSVSSADSGHHAITNDLFGLMFICLVMVINIKHYVDHVGVSPTRSNWRQVTVAILLVQEAKCAKHAETCLEHGFDFVPFSICVLGSFRLVISYILTRVHQPYVSYARIRPREAH